MTKWRKVLRFKISDVPCAGARSTQQQAGIARRPNPRQRAGSPPDRLGPPRRSRLALAGRVAPKPAAVQLESASCLRQRCGEESQQPTCPQVRHRRKCTHLEPILRRSSQPSALGVTSRIISRCWSTISSPSFPVRRSADRSVPRSCTISHLCGAQLILHRPLLIIGVRDSRAFS